MNLVQLRVVALDLELICSSEFSFEKQSQVQFNSQMIELEKPYDYLIINNININMKKFSLRKRRKIFLGAIFSHSSKLFSKFPHKSFVNILRDIISLENFPLPFSQS